MKNTGLVVAALAVLSLASCSTDGKDAVLIEAESFSNPGGWVIDQQFTQTVGSPYLLAHGMGKPVADAVADVALPAPGRWHLYVRTYNWTAPWHTGKGPGEFQVAVDGNTLKNVCGSSGSSWEWQYAGSFRANADSVRISLHDISGFDGRCDAVYISRSRLSEDPVRPVPAVSQEREYDFVVVGGGVAGMCAAVSAARLGLRTALVHDRPVLGGNNSSEVRVHLGGEIELEPYPNLGNTIKEWGHTERGNAGPAERYQDFKKEAFVSGEKNLTVWRSFRCDSVETAGDRIAAVVARNICSGETVRFKAPLFADCTGDASVGVLAGADFAYGREGKDDYDEPSAPEKADRQVLGASVQWRSTDAGAPCGFPDFSYGLEFTDESVCRVREGEWTWETGMLSDMITEAEKVRDYALLVVYSNWSYLKNHASGAEDFETRDLEWVSFIAGKRESRRLLGDIVLREQDIVGGRKFPDGTVTGSWSIDLHYPDPANTKFFPGKEFISVCVQEPVDYYQIPYRCLYSRNVSNLFMAGRNISVTHIVLGTTRVMRTTAMEGEVVGMAAAIASRHGESPRDVYERRFPELAALMKEGTGRKGLPNNQRFNGGHEAPAGKR